jgi:hypothetical protein
MLELLDSPALDNHSAYQSWLEQAAPKYFEPARLEQIVQPQDLELSFPPIFSNRGSVDPLIGDAYFSGDVIPRLVRDGGPRVINKKIWDLEASSVQGGVYLKATGSAVFVSTLEQSELLDYQRFLEGEFTTPPFCLDENGQRREGCNSDIDLSEARYYPARFHVGLLLKPKGNSWEISSFSNYFSVSYPSEFSEATFLTQLRESIKQ